MRLSVPKFITVSLLNLSVKTCCNYLLFFYDLKGNVFLLLFENYFLPIKNKFPLLFTNMNFISFISFMGGIQLSTVCRDIKFA